MHENMLAQRWRSRSIALPDRERARKRARGSRRRTASIDVRMSVASIDARRSIVGIDARRSIDERISVDDLRSTVGSEGIEERIVPPWIDPCAVEYIVVRCVPNSPPPGSAARLDPAPRCPASDIRRSLHKSPRSWLARRAAEHRPGPPGSMVARQPCTLARLHRHT